jgi:hypothetical protein
MATVPIRSRLTPQMARRAVTQRRPVVDPGFNFNAGASPYVRPRITGMVVGDEPIPAQRPSFGGPGGVIPPAGAPPATTPLPGPGPVAPPAGGGGTEFGVGAIPGRGMGPLSWNPQLLLPDTALAKAGALDSQYTSDKNTAMSEFYNKYHATLQKLGYMDPQGHAIEGSIDLGYRRKHALGLEALSDEERQNTEDSRDLGNLFSGARVRSLLDAQRETTRSLADLDIDTESDILGGYTDLGDIRDTFNRAIQQAIANAIYRKTGSYNFNFQQ